MQAGRPGMAAGEIARQLNMPPNTLSTNLMILSHAGLVESRREGRSVIYTVRYESMTELLEYLMEDCCGGSPEICASLTEFVLRLRCDTPASA